MVLRPSRRHLRPNIKPGNDELFRCRDAPSHPSFAYAKKSQAKKAFPKTPPLKEGRRSAERRTTGPHRQAMRRAPFLLSSHCGKTEAQDFIKSWTSKNGAGALASRRPTADSERFLPSARLGPRFLESPDANGRTLSGTSAASTSRSGHAPDGTMPKPPVGAVYRYAFREPLPLRLKEYPREGVLRRAGFWLGNCNGDESQGQCRIIRDAP
jgi:hypothetical protein